MQFVWYLSLWVRINLGEKKVKSKQIIKTVQKFALHEVKYRILFAPG